MAQRSARPCVQEEGSDDSGSTVKQGGVGRGAGRAAGVAGGRSVAARPPKPAPVDLATAKPGRDPNQPIDEEYTKKIKEYTTETFFLSPLVDYLPASKTVPTPKAVLGDVAGAPGKLPYTAEVHDYMRLLAKATPRVKVRVDRHERRRPRDDRGRRGVRSADGAARGQSRRPGEARRSADDSDERHARRRDRAGGRRRSTTSPARFIRPRRARRPR